MLKNPVPLVPWPENNRGRLRYTPPPAPVLKDARAEAFVNDLDQSKIYKEVPHLRGASQDFITFQALLAVVDHEDLGRLFDHPSLMLRVHLIAFVTGTASHLLDGLAGFLYDDRQFETIRGCFVCENHVDLFVISQLGHLVRGHLAPSEWDNPDELPPALPDESRLAAASLLAHAAGNHLLPPMARGEALEALASGSPEQAAPAVRRGLGSRHPELLAGALSSLGCLPEKEQESVIERLMGHSSVWVKNNAIAAKKKLDGAEAAAIARAQELRRDIEVTAEILGMVCTNERREELSRMSTRELVTTMKYVCRLRRWPD